MDSVAGSHSGPGERGEVRMNMKNKFPSVVAKSNLVFCYTVLTLNTVNLNPIIWVDLSH